MIKKTYSLKRISILIAIFCIACHSSVIFAKTNKTDDLCTIKSYEMAIRYQQQSAEVYAIQLQTYALATLRLQQILEQNQGNTDKLAIVSDIDETIIDNTSLLARDLKHCHDFTVWDTWNDWEKYGNPELIPGALDFFNYANKVGIKIFYVSDRFQENKTATLTTLKDLALPQVSKDNVLLYNAPKEDRRMLVSKDYKIVMLLGDSLPDFSKDFSSKLSLAEQHQQVIKNKSHFGVDWIILPNSAYGSWRNAPLKEWDKN